MKYVITQDLLNRTILTYNEILAIKKRLNGYSKTREAVKKFTDNENISQPEWVKPTADNYTWHEEYRIAPDHAQKGIDWLYKITILPSKLEAWKRGECDHDTAQRGNCPLGYRELDILLHYDHFTFTGLYDNSTSYQVNSGYHNYLPLWKLYSKDGDSFEYYVSGGEINIIG